MDIHGRCTRPKPNSRKHYSCRQTRDRAGSHMRCRLRCLCSPRSYMFLFRKNCSRGGSRRHCRYRMQNTRKRYRPLRDQLRAGTRKNCIPRFRYNRRRCKSLDRPPSHKHLVVGTRRHCNDHFVNSRRRCNSLGNTQWLCMKKGSTPTEPAVLSFEIPPISCTLFARVF